MKPYQKDYQIDLLLRQLYDDDREIRINAITQLGEVGDEICLAELRELLKYISKEHKALIIAVGRLKKELGIK